MIKNPGVGTAIPASAIRGTTTNDNAPAGFIGELIVQTIPIGSSVALTNGAASTIATISLTAGDWDVYGVVDITTGATTNWTSYIIEISPTNNSIAIGQPGGSGFGPEPYTQIVSPTTAGTVTGALSFNTPTPIVRVSIAATTSAFLVIQASFTVSTMTAFGTIRARRVR